MVKYNVLIPQTFFKHVKCGSNIVPVCMKTEFVNCIYSHVSMTFVTFKSAEVTGIYQ